MILFWGLVAFVIWIVGFLCGCWCVITQQEGAANSPGSELEEPGLCRHCWGDCPPTGCTARFQRDNADEEPLAPSDEWAALRVQFPHLTPAQLATILERRCQERRQ
jgi:hypothetical protein